MFTLMNAKTTAIDFQNDLPYTEEFNTYTYRNFYNGGGVALGDINNDGLVDIYFSGNIVDSKLYLNKGNWKFEDITEKAGVACKDIWSTGVSFADVNGDGWLDLYVCKAGKPGGVKRHNELFINQGDLTFKEESEKFGLNVTGLSIHSAFFDYDKDGDLDCYLLSNSLRSVAGFNFKKGLRSIPDPEGNKLFRNDNGIFTDVTQSAGLYGSNIGYGLGITLSDFNQDNWPDIFISNDFFEKDYLYFNQQDGTFKEVSDSSFFSMSMGSMGADACDVDNDLLPDLFVTEMLPETIQRKRTKAQYETWDKYQEAVKNGYHHQFTRNAFHRNIGNNEFIEIGRYAGVAASEWSWASLIQDFDNDGLKDLFVSNGIYKDLLDKDYLNFFADDVMIKSKIDNNEEVITVLVDSMPSNPIRNHMYKNQGDFNFENVSSDWGLEEKTFSNGSAYGDLDNDGDLDLVINNANMPSFLYRNNLDTAVNRSIQFKLVGNAKNKNAIGAKVLIKYGEGKQAMLENYTSKGFESTVDGKIHFGVAGHRVVDSVWIFWPDDNTTLLTSLATNQLHEVHQETTTEKPLAINIEKEIHFSNSSISFKHQAIKTNLFARERLLIEMSGFDGPGLAVGDVNADGIEDVFVGGGKKQESGLFLSDEAGNFVKQTAAFADEANAEVVAAKFFDADQDGDLDLYVAHGGHAFSQYAPELQDEIYINLGNGNFEKRSNLLKFPNAVHTGDVSIADYDKDGDLDILVAERMKNKLTGLPGSCYLFKNNGELNFERQELSIFKDIGMITDSEFADINADGWLDLILVGKWMPIRIFYNTAGDFNTNSVQKTIPQSSGLWNVMTTFDVDHDGDLDIICGNEGLNNFYSEGMRLCINDFDKNGAKEQIVCAKEGEKYFPVHAIDELYSQMPGLKKKYVYYEAFSKASMLDLFGKEALDASLTLNLEELQSMVFLNQGEDFDKLPLPNEIQYSSTHAIHITKAQNGDQIFTGGNNFKVKPQFGRQDGSLGWKFNSILEGNKISFSHPKSMHIRGQVRAIESFNDNIIFGINNEEIKIYKK